jgi:hypothetical protein
LPIKDKERTKRKKEVKLQVQPRKLRNKKVLVEQELVISNQVLELVEGESSAHVQETITSSLM